MSAITIRNIPEATHRALRLRAVQAGRSTEAEIRLILDEAAQTVVPAKIGSEIAALAAQFGGFDLHIERSSEKAQPASFD
jgi:antitoxin FitA